MLGERRGRQLQRRRRRGLGELAHLHGVDAWALTDEAHESLALQILLHFLVFALLVLELMLIL